MRVVVMGGTRFMGVETVQRVLAAGHVVAVVHRGSRAAPPGTEEIVGDRDDPATRARVRAWAPDAVVDFSAYRAEQTRDLLEALPEVGRWVHCSSGAVYRPLPTFPWHEDGPLGPWPLWGGYGHEKLGCEEHLRAGPADRVTVSIRPPYVLGPGNYAPREEFVLNRILDGAPVVIEGDGEGMLHMVSSGEAGEAFAAAVDVDLPAGFHPVNLGSRHLCTSVGFVDLCARAAGREARVHHVPAAAADEPFSTADHVFPFPDRSYVLDTRRLEEWGLVADRPSLEATITAAYEHLMRHPERRQWSPHPRERAALDLLGH